jgi:eukaryotic-like serine/threonine-protein kinase
VSWVSITEGQKLGNYRILERIGVGGMGSVYLAEHPLIGKKVALKVIHRELASNREVVSRFFREAKAVNKIGNEHIVEVHDFGQTPEGEHFFIMEYLEGRTLADELERHRVLDVHRGLHIAAQIANGLSAAHVCGIIHRDLKPDNIMLLSRMGDDDFVKVLDFGLAKVFVDSAGAKLTGQGVVLGTPQYMSPEACESKPDVDHRADIYSLGVLLFQMVTGQVPFDGNTMGEILVKHVAHPPPAPRALAAQVPPSVEQIILRCLAKAPDSRFATMKDLREALLDPDRYLAGSPPVMVSAPTSASPEARTMFGARAEASPPSKGTGRQFALAPPPPSMPGASTAAATAKTAFMGAAVSEAAGTARTQFMDEGDQAVAASRKKSLVPDMSPPAQAVNHTMVIGTPAGYSDHPPRRLWPALVAGLSVLTVIGAAVALLVWPGYLAGGEAAPVAGAAPPAPPPPPDAAVETAPAEPELPALARITLVTAPAGAEVFDIEGKRLGITPTEIALPLDGSAHELIFRHPDTEERRKVLVPESDTTLTVELPPREPEPRPAGTHSGGKRGGKSGGKRDPAPPDPQMGTGRGDTVLKPSFGP